jgi:hypothetical protein
MIIMIIFVDKTLSIELSYNFVIESIKYVGYSCTFNSNNCARHNYLNFALLS